MIYGNELTNAEKKVAVLVAKGMSSKTVAQILNIANKTVKFHLTTIYKKYGVKSRYEFIVEYNKKRAFKEEDALGLPSGINR